MKYLLKGFVASDLDELCDEYDNTLMHSVFGISNSEI